MDMNQNNNENLARNFKDHVENSIERAQLLIDHPELKHALALSEQELFMSRMKKFLLKNLI